MAETFQLAASALLVVSLMLAAGLRLRPRDLLVLGAHPALLIAAVVVNVIVVPGLALVVTQALALPTGIVIGLMLSAATPGGSAAVLYVAAARPRGFAPPPGALDEVAMAVSLTIVLPFIGLLSTPLTLALVPDLPADVAVPVGPVVRSLVVLQALPLVVGMLLLAKAPIVAGRLEKVARMTGNLTLAGMTLALLILKGSVLKDTPVDAIVAMAVIVVLTPVVGYLAGRPAGRHTARAGAIVALSRSSSVAIMLSSTFFRDPVVDATVLTFALVVVVVPLVLARVWHRRSS
jgi:bile acid:Na+ symporter, BASS family